MKERLMYVYRVTHPEYGKIEVKAGDRLRAACEAGKAWGIRWTAIATDCTYERIGPAPEPEEKKAPPRKLAAAKNAKEGR